ncbi:MAG: CGNR zinc finger domain-containing protein [Candidatus Dormiibacterota bacterium]
MNFDSYTDRGVQAAAELANQLTESWAQGAFRALPSGGGPRRKLAAAVETSIWGRSGDLSTGDAEGLIRLATQLRLIFQTLASGELDSTAQLVNALLQKHHAAPQLATHDGEPWHLHFHSQEKEAGRAEARGATCATALATVIGSGGAWRLGTCRANRCDQVFVDTSKNGRRRFCSPRCLSRDKVARFRARHQAGTLGEE